MRTQIRLAAATVLVAAAGVAVQSPAHAAACGTADGVTVVVDFNGLGGGVQQACVSGGGTASDLFVAAEHSLVNVNNSAFVCRVDNKPSPQVEGCARTPPPNKYWGLWWSNGTSGEWIYATQGAYSQRVPDGGSVAFSWNGTSSRSAPSAPAPNHTDQPSSPPSSGGGGSGSGAGSGGGSGAGGGGSAGESRPRQPGGTGSTGGSAPSPSSGPSTSPSASASADGEASRDGRARDRASRSPEARERAEQKRERDRAQRAGDATKRSGSTGPSASSDPSDTASSAAPAGTDQTSEPATAGEAGLPAWIAPVAIGALFAVAAVAAWLRRRAA